MSAEEQLDFVEKYLEPYRGMLGGIEDVYMSILWPRGVGKPADYILFSAGSAAYEGNKGLDIDKDGHVTKEEASRKVVQLLEEGMRYAYEEDQAPAPVEERDTQAALEEPMARPPEPVSEEKPMALPFLIPAITSLISIAPDLIRLFGKGPMSQRNATVAEKIVGVAREVTGAINSEQAVNRIQGGAALAERWPGDCR